MRKTYTGKPRTSKVLSIFVSSANMNFFFQSERNVNFRHWLRFWTVFSSFRCDQILHHLSQSFWTTTKHYIICSCRFEQPSNFQPSVPINLNDHRIDFPSSFCPFHFPLNHQNIPPYVPFIFCPITNLAVICPCHLQQPPNFPSSVPEILPNHQTFHHLSLTFCLTTKLSIICPCHSA